MIGGTATVVNIASHPQPPQDVIPQYPISLVDFRKRYRKILLAFGITEVVLGGFLVFLSIAALTLAKGPNYYFGGDVYCFFGDFFTYVGIGIWCGTCGLLAGVLGIVIKIKQSASLYIANMTLAIITAHFSCVGVVLSSLAARFSVCQSELRELHIAIACICFIMMVANIAHAAISCSRTCCDEGYIIPQQISSTLQQDVVNPQTAFVNNPSIDNNEIEALRPPDPVALKPPEKHEEVHSDPVNLKNEDNDKVEKPLSNPPRLQLESRVDRSEWLLKPQSLDETNGGSS